MFPVEPAAPVVPLPCLGLRAHVRKDELVGQGSSQVSGPVGGTPRLGHGVRTRSRNGSGRPGTALNNDPEAQGS